MLPLTLLQPVVVGFGACGRQLQRHAEQHFRPRGLHVRAVDVTPRRLCRGAVVLLQAAAADAAAADAALARAAGCTVIWQTAAGGTADTAAAAGASLYASPAECMCEGLRAFMGTCMCGQACLDSSTCRRRLQK